MPERNETRSFKRQPICWMPPAAYAKMAHAENPYGDGNAAQRICETLDEYIQ